MRVPARMLMTADTIGGVWTYSLELCRALAAHGTRITLATSGAPLSPCQRAGAAAVPELDIRESAYRLEWMEEPWADVNAASRWLTVLSEEIKPNIIHLNEYSQGAVSWSAPCIVVAHSCVVSWWHAVHRTDPPNEWSAYRRRVQSGLESANGVVAVSRTMADSLEKHYGIRHSSVVYNGGRTPASKQSCGAKENFILTCGRAWDAAKNISAVNAIAPALDWPVYVAGETAHPQGGMASLHHTQTLGRLSEPELRAWLDRASIFALPSKYEPFGLSVLEAAQSGCALALGDIPSLRELWEGAALFVDPFDNDSIATGLRSVIQSVDLRLNLAEEAAKRALAFSTKRMLAGYLDVYARATRNFAAREAETSCAS